MVTTGVEAAASGFGPDADCGQAAAAVAPAAVSGAVTDGPSAGPAVSRAVAPMESPASAAVKACSRSGVELLVGAVPETEAVTAWLDFQPSVSCAAAEALACAAALQASDSFSTCSLVRLGAEVQVMMLVTGAETLKDLGDNNPEIPQNKTRQILKLHRIIVAKHLQAQISYAFLRKASIYSCFRVIYLYVEAENKWGG